MNKAIFKKLIPIWVDHNNEYHKLEGYLIHKDTGEVYTNKRRGRPTLRKTSVPNKYIRIYPYDNMYGYPLYRLADNKIFSDLFMSRKYISAHKLVIISNIIHYDMILDVLKKAYPHIPKEELENTPISILKTILRLSQVNHKDHNKKNHNYNNLEIVSAQGNSSAFQKHLKKTKKHYDKHVR